MEQNLWRDKVVFVVVKFFYHPIPTNILLVLIIIIIKTMEQSTNFVFVCVYVSALYNGKYITKAGGGCV